MTDLVIPLAAVAVAGIVIALIQFWNSVVPDEDELPPDTIVFGSPVMFEWPVQPKPVDGDWRWPNWSQHRARPYDYDYDYDDDETESHYNRREEQ